MRRRQKFRGIKSFTEGKKSFRLGRSQTTLTGLDSPENKVWAILRYEYTRGIRKPKNLFLWPEESICWGQIFLLIRLFITADASEGDDGGHCERRRVHILSEGSMFGCCALKIFSKTTNFFSTFLDQPFSGYIPVNNNKATGIPFQNFRPKRDNG